jgi:lipid-A-disaccharide synthase
MRAMSRPLRVFICAAEHSGDGHGAALAKRLRARYPDIVLTGAGGKKMEEAGVKVHFDMVENAAMGVIPVLKKLPYFVRRLQEVSAQVIADQADVFVPIDSPDFNLRIAKRIRHTDVAICYYVSPQVWAWGPRRIHKIAKLVDHMMVLFPFEQELYRGVEVPCTFVGHPLFDELRMRKPSPGFRAGLGLAPDTPLLGLLPGSRRLEVERNLPKQLAAARLVAAKMPEVRFAIPVARPTLQEQVERVVAEQASDLPVTVLEGLASDVARVARAAICVSGTVTLELLHYECPMVVVYQTTRLAYTLIKPILTVKNIALVNILAQREICPEYVDYSDRTEEVAQSAVGLLRQGKARKQCLTKMRNLRKQVDRKGTHTRAARVVLAVAEARRAGQAFPAGLSEAQLADEA